MSEPAEQNEPPKAPEEATEPKDATETKDTPTEPSAPKIGPPSPNSRPPIRVSPTYALALKLHDLNIPPQYLSEEHLEIFRMALSTERSWDQFYELKAGSGLEGATFVASFRARTMILEQQIPLLYPHHTDAPAPSTSTPNTRKRTRSSGADELYYSAELDAATLKEARASRAKSKDKEKEVEKVVEQPGPSGAGAEPVAPAQPVLSLMPQVPQSFSRKHLMSQIALLPPDLSTTLTTIVTETRPHSSSKWFSDTRQGQEELYTPTERVLNELKEYKDCSGPFLLKVNRREYPDYYDIIVNPMDLGTMTKKLKGFEYDSRAEIVADLDLIWSNCFTYNSDPANIYRIMGERMKARSDSLVPLIPEITITTRTDISAPIEEYEDDESDDEEGDGGEEEKQPEGPTGSRAWGTGSKAQSSKGLGSKGAKGSRGSGSSGGAGRRKDEKRGSPHKPADKHRPQEKKHKPPRTSEPPSDLGSQKDRAAKEEPQIKLEDGSTSMDVDVVPAVDEKPALEIGGVSGTDETRQPEPIAVDPEPVPVVEEVAVAVEPEQEPIPELSEAERAELELELSDPRTKAYYELSLPLRTATLLQRFDDVQKPFAERKGLVRSGESMGAFVEGEERFLEKLRGLDTTEIDGEGESDAQPALFLPEWQYPTSCLPELPGPSSITSPAMFDSDVVHKMERAMPTASAYKSARMVEGGALSEAIKGNTEEIRRVQDLWGRVVEVTNGEDHEIRPPWAPPKSKARKWSGDESKLPELKVNEEIGYGAMRQVCARLLAHEGFEASKSDALAVLTDASIEYLSLISRLVRTYLDDFGKEMEPEDMLCHALMDCGVRGLDDFGNYVAVGVVRAGRSRGELRKKLERRYREVLSEAIAEEDSQLLLEEVDSYSGKHPSSPGLLIPGLTLNGINPSKVPERAWKGKTDVEEGQTRVRKAVLHRPSTSDEALVPSTLDLPEPPSFEPLADPQMQLIGLLQPWYNDRVSTSDMMEDDEKVKQVDAKAVIAAYKVRVEHSKLLKKRRELGMVYLDYHAAPDGKRRRQ